MNIEQYAQISINMFICFQDNIVSILHDNLNARIREEAASVVATIYENHTLSTVHLFTLYDVMTYSATEDSDNKVKISSLKFWSKVINSCLVLQGAIDGEFPTITFSKESRKIVIMKKNQKF